MHCGKTHDYLGMTIIYNTKGKLVWMISTMTQTINMENTEENTNLDPGKAQRSQDNTGNYTLCCKYRSSSVSCITPS